MFINLPTIADIENLQLWLTCVLLVGVGLWVVYRVVSFVIDRISHVVYIVPVMRRAARIRAISEEQAERRRFQAVMPARRIQ